eukprot:9887226-Heterocapsa_arctica.AAC.1
MAIVRAALAAAAVTGMEPKVRDATQAYIQARIDGPRRPQTCVRLPKQWWPKEWYRADGAPLYHDPVVLMRLALYGHPESRALWHKYSRGILD